MSRTAPQLNIRSAFARDRAAALARRTGRTTTQVVEDALRAYEPAAPADDHDDLPPPPPGLIRKGWLLVLAREGRRTLTVEEAEAAIDDARDERERMVAHPDGY